MKTLVAVLLIVHGLIVAAQSSGSFSPAEGIKNPSWLTWWPSNLGQSWLLTKTGLEGSPITALGGVVYLLGGVLLIGAGLGLLGWIVPAAWWPALALVGAGTSLMMLIVYLHPFYLIGFSASLVVLISVLWIHWPEFMRLSSI
jgi:hypothetical protein